MNLHICKLHPNAKIPTYATDGAARTASRHGQLFNEALEA